MQLDDILHTLAREPTADIDVAEVGLLLARDEYPDLDVEAYLAELDAMAHEAAAYLRGDLDACLTGFCRYLFHEMGFRGNRQNYYDPQNSYLNVVLERRTGIPISLSAVAISVGRRAGLCVEGVGLPGHFIVKAVRDGREALFDPFHGGRRLDLRDCENLVRQITGFDFQATAEHLRKLPAGRMVQRMLANLRSIYFGQADYRRAARTVARLQQLTPYDPAHERDLGECLLHLDQPGQAVDHLRRYLGLAPHADDRAEVQRLLRTAQGRIAERN